MLPQKVTIVNGGGGGISGGVTAATGAMAVANAPWDSFLTNRSPGGTATITFPATVGKSWLINFVSGSLVNNGAAPLTNCILNANAFNLADAGVQGIVGYSWSWVGSNLAILFAPNTAVTISFSNFNGGVFQTISAGAYLI